MQLRRDGKSDWLFPSRTKDGAVRVLSFKTARTTVIEKSGIAFGFHYFRHYFISHCVMSKVDYLTLGNWVGHKDGGMLIGKIYGHLNDEHSVREAAKVRF